ncbi:MAG: flagellar hook assembly protein FlgD [Gammaproteobacteria bacterium]|nr:flagellar hook assembly protein FlgD [Gammaproteobacteria bacterium]
MNVDSKSIYADLGLTRLPESDAATDPNEMGQGDFLELMTAQLNNQDPTSPMDNSQFLGQLAQFAQVKGITDLQTSFSALSTSLTSNQALQASSMVGQKALVEGAIGVRGEEEPLRGAVNLSASASEVNVSVMDSSGQLVARLNLGMQTKGTTNFEWDGMNDKGEPMPAGKYVVAADAVINGQPTPLTTLMEGRIESVTLGAGNGSGLLFNVAGRGAVNFSEINQIRQ